MITYDLLATVVTKRMTRCGTLAAAALIGMLAAVPGAAQTPSQGGHAQGEEEAAPPSRWIVSQDGVAFATFNAQGSPRGDTDFRSQNWWMLMGSHRLGPGLLTLTAMFTVERLTSPRPGYSEILQVSGAYLGKNIIDRQKPHDVFMQVTAAWRVPLTARTGLTIAGGPVGDPALGPVSYALRASARENPTTPLSHHHLDSTEATEGVLSAALDRGPVTLEGSWFHGREHLGLLGVREPGAFDSWSTRAWYRPTRRVAVQVSTGFLHLHEQLEPGDTRRTGISMSWTGLDDRGRDLAFTLAYDHDVRQYSRLHVFLGEATHRFGGTSVYGRFERLQTESENLMFPTVVHRPHPFETIDWISAATIGAVRDVARPHGVSIGVGGDVVFNTVPRRLVQFYGERPVSYHVFVRLRPRAPASGRVWESTLTEPVHRHLTNSAQ